MEFKTSDPKNLIGIGSLMKTNSNDFNITEIEKEIINGKTAIAEEEENDIKQYKKDIERLTNTFNISNFPAEPDGDASGGAPAFNSEPAKYDFGPDFDDEPEDNQLKHITLEQKKQSHVDEVLRDINDDKDLEFDIDREKEEDDKNALLEQIDMLMMTLIDDGVNLDNIPRVSKSNSMSDIQNVYKILRLKVDRNRYCSFAEELILAAAYGLEHIFDGKKEYFGRRPDLTGWNSSVKIKLRRCRFQTSTLVKEIMQEYNMSAGMQLLLELIPSMFLYSRQRSLANHDSFAQDMKYNEAISNLNSQMR